MRWGGGGVVGTSSGSNTTAVGGPVAGSSTCSRYSQVPASFNSWTDVRGAAMRCDAPDRYSGSSAAYSDLYLAALPPPAASAPLPITYRGPSCPLTPPTLSTAVLQQRQQQQLQQLQQRVSGSAPGGPPLLADTVLSHLGSSDSRPLYSSDPRYSSGLSPSAATSPSLADELGGSGGGGRLWLGPSPRLSNSTSASSTSAGAARAPVLHAAMLMHKTYVDSQGVVTAVIGAQHYAGSSGGAATSSDPARASLDKSHPASTPCATEWPAVQAAKRAKGGASASHPTSPAAAAAAALSLQSMQVHATPGGDLSCILADGKAR